MSERATVRLRGTVEAVRSGGAGRCRRSGEKTVRLAGAEEAVRSGVAGRRRGSGERLYLGAHSGLQRP